MLRWLLAVAAGVVLALTALSVQLGVYAVQAGRADIGLALDPLSAFAPRVLAEQLLIAGNAPAAEALARLTLARAPLSAPAVRTLGLAASAAGDDARAVTWMGLGAALGWGDPQTQLWLADRLIAAGQFDHGMERIDAILRQDIDRPPIFRLLNAIAQVPAARAALVARLALAPAWRRQYLDDRSALAPADIPARIALIGDLRRTPRPVTRDELALFVALLTSRGDVTQAYALWRDGAADPRLIGGGGVYDGGFAAPPAAATYAFEWQIPEGARGNATIEPQDGANPALHITGGEGMPDVLIREQLVLAPGGYALTWRSSGGAGADALAWRVRCGEADVWLPSRTVTAGTAPRIEFAVPAGCGAPVLELHGLAAGGGIDTFIDDVALQRLR